MRRVECIRGSLTLGKNEASSPKAKKILSEAYIQPDVEIFPAFGYGEEPHVVTLLQESGAPIQSEGKVGTFHSTSTKLQLDVALDGGEIGACPPQIAFRKVKRECCLSPGLVARVQIYEGQTMSFVLRNDAQDDVIPQITSLVLDEAQHDTQNFWYNFLAQSRYKGRWMEVVSRSLMILKMLTFGEYSLDSSPFLTFS